MNLLLALTLAACPVTKLENRTDLLWTLTDIENLESAKLGCKKYYPKSECLIRFIKIGFQNYFAICGSNQ